MDIRFLSEGFNGRPDELFDALSPEDVVLLPAFGAPVDWVNKLRARECIVVDTTCGSVLSVWKRVTRYAKKGSIRHRIHPIGFFITLGGQKLNRS